MVRRAQLYLNYKLKSVAHLPWRQMTYKFLNTIVDDLGAFVIKMPTLHRCRWLTALGTRQCMRLGPRMPGGHFVGHSGPVTPSDDLNV